MLRLATYRFATRSVAAAVYASSQPRALSSFLPVCRLFASNTTNDGKTVIVKVPHMADSISEGTLKSISKQPGDFVKADEELASIETDKIDIAVNSPATGLILKYFAKVDDTVVVGSNLCEIEKKDAPPTKTPTTKKTFIDTNFPTTSSIPNKILSPTTPTTTTTTTTTTITTSGKNNNAGRTIGLETRVKMSPMRLKIAERLKESQNTYAALTTFNEVDMSALMQMRMSFKDDVFDEHGVKLGFMSAFVKACCYARNAVPVVMARIEGSEIVYPSSVDISVAVATKKGLVTPVLRQIETMSFIDVEKALADLSLRARENKITMGDLSGGCFTISNGGVFGSLMGTPIINLPQSAILGMHAIKERPVVVGGIIVIRPMMYICLTYDHRLVDGREAVTFLVKVKEAIENPTRMLL